MGARKKKEKNVWEKNRKERREQNNRSCKSRKKKWGKGGRGRSKNMMNGVGKKQYFQIFEEKNSKIS